MPNTGNGDAWDVTDPANGALISAGPLQIRDERLGVQLRLGKEHVAPITGTVQTIGGTATLTNTGGGEHLPGSAIPYTATFANIPSLRPDGYTSLGAGDMGRLWWVSDVGTKSLRVWNGSAFETLSAEGVTNGAVAYGGLGSNSVGTLAIMTAGVNTNGISAQAVVTNSIAPNAVGTNQLALLSVTNAVLAANCVGTTNFITSQGIPQTAIGTYTGNGSASGPTISVGFVPSLIFILHRVNATKLFSVGSALNFYEVSANGLSGTYTTSSSGFQITSSASNVNNSGDTYVYFALKEI